ncbi:MAG: hypothetical protein HC821_01875 [Lewinella sp.]|nr:hypothetical protein [Lewinella sp.]
MHLVPTTQTALDDLCQNLRELAVEQPDELLSVLLALLPPGRAKQQQALLLQSRHKQLLQHTLGQTLAFAELNVANNQLLWDLLLFVNHLVLADFSPEAAARPGLKPGHLLYQVPERMVIGQSHPCRVRVAETLEQLRQDLETEENLAFAQVPLAEVMEVSIIDPSDPNQAAFHILLVSDSEQFVDAYSYTEWLFYVRPLRAGQHELLLKVAVLLVVEGQQRTKNLVLKRSIQVNAEAVFSQENTAAPSTMRRVVAVENAEAVASQPTYAEAPPSPSPFPTESDHLREPRKQTAPAPKMRKPVNGSSRGRRWLTVAASLLVLCLAVRLVFSETYSAEDSIPKEFETPMPLPSEFEETRVDTLSPPSLLPRPELLDSNEVNNDSL